MVHHTGDGSARPSVLETANYQTGPTSHLNFPAIAYTMYVEEDGTLYLCHDFEEVTWANGEGSPSLIQGVGIYNWQTISCCFSGENPTNEQLVSIRGARRAVDSALGRSLEAKGHKQVSHTTCPGPAMDSWLRYVAN